MAKQVMGFTVRNKVRKRLKRIAWEHNVTVSSLIEAIVTGHLRGDFSYENGKEPEAPTLSERADNASMELESILADVQDLELALDLTGTIGLAAKELETLAEGVRSSGVEDDTWEDDDDEEED